MTTIDNVAADPADSHDPWDFVRTHDPQFADAYAALAAVPAEKQHLDPVTQSLVSVAVDAAATGPHAPGIRAHIREALSRGATAQQVLEVLECTATLGIHAMNIGVPILTDVLEERGLRTGPAVLDAHQERIKADFTRTRGYWHAFWDEILELDPEMFEAYTEFSSVPWRTGTLAPKVREFIYIAFDTAATHLYVKGLKLHIENALDHGATPEEVLEVMELASTIGIRSVATGVPILVEEMYRAGGDDGRG